MTPLILASLLIGAQALPSSPSSSNDEQRSGNCKYTGNPKTTSSSSSYTNVHPRKVSGAHGRTKHTNENSASVNKVLTANNYDNSNRYEVDTTGGYYNYNNPPLTTNDNLKGLPKQPTLVKIGYEETKPKAKQITYQPSYQFPTHNIQRRLEQKTFETNWDPSKNIGNEILPKAKFNELKDSYMQKIPLSVALSPHNSTNVLQGSRAKIEHSAESPSFSALKNSYLQGSRTNMGNSAQPQSLNDLQDSYLQGSLAELVNSGLSNSLEDLQEISLQGSTTKMGHSAQSPSLNNFQDNYLQGSTTNMEHPAQSPSLDDLQDSYLQGSATNMGHSAQSPSLNDLQDSYLQGSATNMGNSAQAPSLEDLKDSYLQGSATSMGHSAQAPYLDDLQDSYLQGSATNMGHSTQAPSLDDLQDSYLQGSATNMGHSAQAPSLDDLQDSYLQGSATKMGHSAQSPSLNDLQDSYLQGSTSSMGHSIQSPSLNDLQNSYLQGSTTKMGHSAQEDSYLHGSSTGMLHSTQHTSIKDLEASYLQGISTENGFLGDVKDSYLNATTVAKTPSVDFNSVTSSYDGYLKGSTALDIPLVQTNPVTYLENSYLQGSNTVDVPSAHSTLFDGIKDSYLKENPATNSIAQGMLDFESDEQGHGTNSEALEADYFPYTFNQQTNYTALSQPIGSEDYSLSPPLIPPVPFEYQTPPPLSVVSAAYNATTLLPTLFSSAPYDYLTPPPLTQNPQHPSPLMSSIIYTSTTPSPSPTLDPLVSYEYHLPLPPPLPTTVPAFSYDVQPPSPPPEATVAYSYAIPPPLDQTSMPYYYSSHPVYPSKQYLPTPTSLPVTPVPTIEFIPYNVGAKIWFIPLIFSAYFAVYITALILKSIIRHKLLFPTNLLLAATESRGDHNFNLDQLSKIVTKAIAMAIIRYVRRNPNLYN